MPKRGPRLKITRRLGVELPGLTRKDASKRPTPPGQHGAKSARRRKSEYRKQLEEKQKLRYQYGVTETQLRRYLATALRQPGVTGEALLALLERRLDNVVWRLGYAPTIPAARQLVSHGNVRVNNQRVDRASYQVDVGDTIALSTRARERPSVVEQVERGPTVKLPSHLARDPGDGMVARVIGTPVRGDVPFVVNEAAIIEYYAR